MSPAGCVLLGVELGAVAVAVAVFVAWWLGDARWRRPDGRQGRTPCDRCHLTFRSQRLLALHQTAEHPDTFDPPGVRGGD